MSTEEAPPATGQRRRSRLVVLLAAFGPGLIAANAGNDAGGILTYASAGAQYGYRTLFVMVVITIGLVVVQEMAARLGAYTGEGLVSLIREQFTLRVAAFAVGCLVIANVGLVVSELAGIGAAMELFGVTRYLSIPLAAVGIWAAVVFGSYRYAERVFLVLSFVFVSYPVAAILGHPDWGIVAKQALLPHLGTDTSSRAFLFLVVALIGTTITPYMQLYQAAAVVDKGIGPADYPKARVDTVAGAILANLVSMFIIIATAAAFAHTAHRGPLTSVAEAAQALKPVAGPAAEHLFAAGLLGASALAAAVVPLSTAYAISEAVGVERSVSRTFSQAPLFLGLFTAQLALGTAVSLTPGNLVQRLVAMQFLNGLITPIVLTFILILANRRSVLGNAVNTPRFRVIATISVAIVAVMATIVLLQTLAAFLGFAP